MKYCIVLLLFLSIPQMAYGSEIYEMEPIVVTAQKTKEDIKKVPISLSVIDKETVENTFASQVKDIDALAPGIKIRQQGNFINRLTIRGIGAYSRNIGFDTRAGVYLDGVYLGQSPALNMDLYDLDRIEVLRGPQGTLYGKNTVAGAVNLITTSPHDKFESQVLLSTGNEEYRHAQLMLNTPVVQDKHFARFTINHFDRQGHYKNLVTGDDLENENSTSFRTQFRSFLSDRAEFNFSVDGLFSDKDIILGDPLTDTFAMGPDTQAPDEFDVSFNLESPVDRRMYGASGTLDYEFENNFILTTITAFRHTKIDLKGDLDHSSIDYVGERFIDEYGQFSQEVRINSSRKQQVTYIAGLYYIRQDAETDRNVTFGDAITSLGDPRLIAGNSVPNKGEVITNSYAGFFNGAYAVTKKISLDAGVRYTYEKKEADFLLDGSNSGFFNIAYWDFDDTYSDSALTPSGGLRYFFNKNLTGYAKVSTGFKSGGFNLDWLTENEIAEGVEYKKETVISYETGLKSDLLDHRLTADLSFFYAQFDDYQVHQLMDLGGGVTAISLKNAAEVTSKGMELEIVLKPISDLKIDAGLSLLDATFDEFPGGGIAGADASGNELPYAPGFTCNIGIEYVLPVNMFAAELMIRGDYFHTDDYYTQVSNVKSYPLTAGGSVPFDFVESYDLLSVTVALSSMKKGWETFLWAKNITDESYVTDSMRDFLGTVVAIRGMPRTFGIGFSYRFR